MSITIVETRKITTTVKPIQIIGEVAAGVRGCDDPEFKAAARLLVRKHMAAQPIIPQLLAEAA